MITLISILCDASIALFIIVLSLEVTVLKAKVRALEVESVLRGEATKKN